MDFVVVSIYVYSNTKFNFRCALLSKSFLVPKMQTLKKQYPALVFSGDTHTSLCRKKMTIPSQGRADTAACTSPSLLLLAKKVLLFSLLAKDGGGGGWGEETQTHIVALPQKFRKKRHKKQPDEKNKIKEKP